jgi:hypothetical protein
MIEKKEDYNGKYTAWIFSDFCSYCFLSFWASEKKNFILYVKQLSWTVDIMLQNNLLEYWRQNNKNET